MFAVCQVLDRSDLLADAVEEPIPFTQSSWGQVGEAVCISILDLYGHNCHSRLPNTRQASLRGLLGATIRPRTGRTTRIKDIMPNGVGLSMDDIAARERPCRSACGWQDGIKEAAVGNLRPSRLASKESSASRPTSKAGRKPTKAPPETDSDPEPASKASTREPLPDPTPSKKAPRPEPVQPVAPSPELSGESKAQRSRSLDLRRGRHRVERLPSALLPDTLDTKGEDGKSGKEGKTLPRNSMQLVRPQRKRTHSLDASRGAPKADLGAKVRPQLLLEISRRTGAAVTVGAC